MTNHDHKSHDHVVSCRECGITGARAVAKALRNEGAARYDDDLDEFIAKTSRFSRERGLPLELISMMDAISVSVDRHSLTWADL